MLQMTILKKKLKKQKEKKKFKVNKSTDFKFYCVQKKKSKIFAEKKVEQIEFIGKPKVKIEPANIEISNDIKPAKSTPSFYTGNNNNDKNNLISENDNKNKEDNNKNETKLIFIMILVKVIKKKLNCLC